MKIIKYILYKPYFLLFIYLGGNLYYFASQHTIWKTLDAVVLYSIYIVILRLLFALLRSSLLRLLNLIAILNRIPDRVLSGYLFIFTLLNPILAIIIAIIGLISKLFIRGRINQKSYVDAYGNEITQIKSLTPTIILSRKEKNGEEEHIVMTKLKKKPKKITYE